jgi:hypothetical protein
MRFGCAELHANSGDPQIGQNSRVAMFPLSAIFSNRRGSPLTMSKAARSTMTVGAYALPPASWQSRQWQLTMLSGVERHSNRMVPHEQPPASGAFKTRLPEPDLPDLPKP